VRVSHFERYFSSSAPIYKTERKKKNERHLSEGTKKALKIINLKCYSTRSMDGRMEVLEAAKCFYLKSEF
jgi:hypothetical protein